MHELINSIFSWIPGQNFAVVKSGLAQASLSSPDFLLACAPLAILCLLSLIPSWARFNDSPWIFACTHSIPFFLLTFRESLGDAGQVIDGVGARYHMSEPLATWVHYWFFRLLHEPFNVGAKDAVAWSSRAGGLFYAFLIAKVSLKLFPGLSATRRLLHRLIFLTAGVALLFHGYIENPPLALPAEQLWVLASITFLLKPSALNTAYAAAMLALATAVHGRVGFLFPALAFSFLIPSGSLLKRITRATLGSTLYFGLLAAFVGYVFYFERNYVSGGAYGNVTGGGNRQMFVALKQIFTSEHLFRYLAPLLVAGGVLTPLGVLISFRIYRRPGPIAVWCLGYIAAALTYVLLWEFDYGPYLDWDLVFSAVMPLILLASLVFVPSRIPTVCFVPFLLMNVYLSNTFATLVNGRPLNLNLVPTATLPMQDTACREPGLIRTFYSDPQLTKPLSAPEADIPHHEYGPLAIPGHQPGLPVGGRFEGYITIPEPGRYRFFLLAQRNARLRIGGVELVNRWIDYEWRVSSERELRLPSAGMYPFSVEFFANNYPFPLQVEIESSKYPRRKIRFEDLCHN
jgi:hypothetical protein